MALANDVVFTLYGGEIVIEQHEGRRFAGDVGAAAAHGDANMRGF